MTLVPSTTRAVDRLIEAGTDEVCPWCEELVKFAAAKKLRQIVANVYGRSGDMLQWDRCEHWHPSCYREAGNPYGEPT